MTLQILVDKDFHAIVGTIAGSGDDYSRFDSMRRLSEKLQSYVIGNNTIKGIMLLPLNEKLQVVASGSSTTSRGEVLMSQPWFQETIELNGRVKWIAPQEEGLSTGPGQQSIGISRMLKDSVSSNASYILLLDIDVKSFSDRYADVSLGEGSKLTIVDGNGNYVIAEEASSIGQAASVKLPASEAGEG
ncbi:cache domain-containing protein, partial [Mycobacterium tuberculosis]